MATLCQGFYGILLLQPVGFCIVHYNGFPGTHGKVKQLTSCHLLNLAFSFSAVAALTHTHTHSCLSYFRLFSFKGPPIGHLSGSAALVALSKQRQNASFTCCYSELQTLDNILSHMRVPWWVWPAFPLCFLRSSSMQWEKKAYKITVKCEKSFTLQSDRGIFALDNFA